MDTPEEHRARWEAWAEQRLGPGFRVLTWSTNQEYYQISLVRDSEGKRETVIYTKEEKA